MIPSKFFHIGLSLILLGVIISGVIWWSWKSSETSSDGLDPDWRPPSVAGFVLNSSAFADQTEIPIPYTCEGNNRSLPLKWTGAPKETQAYVLVMEDRDVGTSTWIHWIGYNLPANIQAIEEGSLPTGGTYGKNSFGNLGYTGPCPVKGEHTYWVRLFALDRTMNFPHGLTWQTVEAKIRPHVLGVAELSGTYYPKP